jgi:hypothetical protein
MAIDAFIAIVSGLPRSGTSMMMQILAAGGIPLMEDNQRQPDDDNPRGYFELEAVKDLARDHAVLDGAEGKALKIIHALLTHLPLDRFYRVIFMRRDLDEVLSSQRKMLDRSGRTGAALTVPQLKSIFARQLEQSHRWLASHAERIQTLEVDYATVISDPRTTARDINAFLGGTLDEDAMAAAVDPSLHRNRGGTF